MSDNTDIVDVLHTHQQRLNKVIRAINSHDWLSAKEEVRSWKDLIDSILLIQFCEPNSVQKEFNTLNRRLSIHMPPSIKSKEVKEAIADILDKLSLYGLSIGKNNNNNSKEKLSKTIQNLINLIDSCFSSVMVTPVMSLSNKDLSYIRSLKLYVNSLEKLISDYEDDKQEIMEIKEYTLSSIADFKADLATIFDGRNRNPKISESYRLMIDSVSKFSRAIVSENLEPIISVFESLRGVDINRSRKISGETGEIEIPPPPPSGEFKWVDEDWERLLQHPRVFLIIGHRGSGKSCLGYAILEYYAKKYGLRAYLLKSGTKPIPQHKIKALPNWITIINNPDEAAINSVVLYDEAYGKYHARTTHRSDAPIMDALIELTRHKNCTSIYVSQASSKIDRNIIGAIDVLFIKKPTEFRVKFERDEVRNIVQMAYEAFQKIRGDPTRYVYVYEVVGPEFRGMKTNGVASFWNEELSTFYSGW